MRDRLMTWQGWNKCFFWTKILASLEFKLQYIKKETGSCNAQAHTSTVYSPVSHSHNPQHLPWKPIKPYGHYYFIMLTGWSNLPFILQCRGFLIISPPWAWSCKSHQIGTRPGRVGFLVRQRRIASLGLIRSLRLKSPISCARVDVG